MDLAGRSWRVYKASSIPLLPSPTSIPSLSETGSSQVIIRPGNYSHSLTISRRHCLYNSFVVQIKLLRPNSLLKV